MIGAVDLEKTAIVGNDFLSAVKAVSNASDVISNSSITLTHYAPNELRYSYSSDSDRLAVFSEIYYPKGWKAWIEPAGAYGKVKDGHYILPQQ